MQHIPKLLDEGFIKLHPGVIVLADENSGGVRRPSTESTQEELENGLIELNPLIIGGPETDPEQDPSINYKNLHELLEPIFIEALSRKCA